jgi:hypothetical protein
VPLQPQAPYDSLAIVTQLVRSLLGDFIQNLQPFNQGTVTVGITGYTIAWNSGNQFTALMNGQPILINGVPNVIGQVTSPTTATLLNQAAVAAAVPYSLSIPVGEIFNDSQAYVVPSVNAAWRKLQQALAERGHPRLENTAILTGLPVIANLDPGVEQYMNWAGFYDGVNFWTPATLVNCPTLPADWISPIYCEERQSVAGATAANPNLTKFREMRPASDGLRGNWAKGSYNRIFDWKEDGLYLPGSIYPMDIKTRYAAFLPDIAPAGSFATTPVPIMRCASALANYTASIFVVPRGGQMIAGAFDTAGDKALDQITNSQSKLQQRASYSRKPWGRRGSSRGRLVS